jgi:hypothetical protein
VLLSILHSAELEFFLENRQIFMHGSSRVAMNIEGRLKKFTLMLSL